MKTLKFLTLIAALSLGIFSCTKDLPQGQGGNPFSNPGGGGSTTTDPDPGLPVGEVPGSFTKKAVVEKITGEWCGYCPDGATVLDGIMAANPDKVIGIAIHGQNGDPFEIPYHSWIKGQTGSGGYPTASIDRADRISRGSWPAAVSTSLAKTAECGIAMVSEENGGILDLDERKHAPISDNIVTHTSSKNRRRRVPLCSLLTRYQVHES